MSIPICIFAKPAVPTEVKTRLIPAIGAVRAARLATAMLLDTWRTVAACPGVRPVLATTRCGDFPMPVPPEDVWLQGEGDLGARIERIMMRGLLDSPAAVALGADSPTLTPAHLAAALDAIRTNDAVAGPSRDGGFYLLALTRCQPGLFAALPWSQPGTLQALRQRLDQHAFSVAEIETLFDIDTPEDLRLLESAPPGSATRAWCSEPCE